ncbi:nitrogenase cofactor biosynthesis protein NifB [Sporobacter termitidis DSM 10068]|uniref:FeMo cofactor biosynthesis protein NifB n=1 Tax=Sporobacter termitidis DSM 10068 TaxID=1123282 RepID=A0A1M5XJN0_9FIRM|nr:nitrogenase cofactor biosynthesis protein NifB [Sporobacter termitidis]SHH99758.1 nitrogenase cofactor biosynthesis protein NifB [Sporobacter termitidis DSM 10068]
MGANLKSLNVNPCKMCMPMGAVSAFAGIKNCMSILHGSQGCATYIRRHMATHYNEPVDIASSSLTEHGTVFGGRENLLKGLENLIKLYNPQIIGVATTCLAETIGEDVPAIIREFYDTHPESTVKIVSVASAGYGGTQYEGFNRALWSVVSQADMDPTPNGYMNIVTPMLSPADCRLLKNLLDSMGLKYVLLPDLSENLDGVHVERYERLKGGGTSLADISKMAGARHTIELSLFNGDKFSPGKYLEERYGVPLTKMALPVGIRDTDAFIDTLAALGGARPEALVTERGRYIDAMIDNHKYCADGRAAIFGEPDFVYSMTRLCCENGTVPVIAATGSVCPALKAALEDEVRRAADRALTEGGVVLDDCDFDLLENHAKALGVNLMIGSSDGRRTARRLGVDIVRCAFPIHDRVGGQRIKTLCYEGSLNILDQVANDLLAKKEEGFREELYDRYFDKEQQAAPVAPAQDIPSIPDMLKKTETHPCFNCSGGKYARIHLPIAPKCNIQCNYCVRKYDCPNESRPGVTTSVLAPEEAVERYVAAKSKIPNLSVVGIAGPGDALANFDETRETLRRIRALDPDVTFCLSTNGLLLPLYAQELIDLGVSHITVTVNAVDPEIGAKIYKHIDYMGTRFTGLAAASILLANQLSGLRYLTSRGIICKVNTVLLRGINDTHIEEVVKKVKELGAYISNIMQLIPVKGSAFENLELVSNREIMAIREKCAPELRQMYHCRQCRADAVGTLDEDQSLSFRSPCKSAGARSVTKTKKYAVASKSGSLVDQHFGHAREFYIYESDGAAVRFIEKRLVKNYCNGKEDCFEDKKPAMDSILSAVSDCGYVLALRIGDAPARKLQSLGIEVISTYDRIEDAVLKAAAGQQKKEIC